MLEDSRYRGPMFKYPANYETVERADFAAICASVNAVGCSADNTVGRKGVKSTC